METPQDHRSVVESVIDTLAVGALQVDASGVGSSRKPTRTPARALVRTPRCRCSSPSPLKSPSKMAQPLLLPLAHHLRK
eukprot:7008057-Pyramimonas_sp.AAC.1